MRSVPFAYLFAVLLILAGCRERQSAAAVRDACSLISKEEVESVQGTPVKETKSSERSDGVFLVSQCFYTAAEFSKSVSLSLIQKNPNGKDKHSPKDFWKEKFSPSNPNEEERHGKPETNSAEKETGTPPRRISGLGDDAYWVGNRFGGMLYILKGDAFISISLGGTDDEDTKLKKSRILAQKALQRL